MHFSFSKLGRTLGATLLTGLVSVQGCTESEVAHNRTDAGKRKGTGDIEVAKDGQVTIVASRANLPKCNEAREGSVFVVTNLDKQLLVCHNNSWDEISVAGQDGQKGDKGDKGDQGEKGDKGDKGSQGKDAPIVYATVFKTVIIDDLCVAVKVGLDLNFNERLDSSEDSSVAMISCSEVKASGILYLERGGFVASGNIFYNILGNGLVRYNGEFTYFGDSALLSASLPAFKRSFVGRIALDPFTVRSSTYKTLNKEHKDGHLTTNVEALKTCNGSSCSEVYAEDDSGPYGDLLVKTSREYISVISAEIRWEIFGQPLTLKFSDQPQTRILFITAQTYQGNFGGIDAADAICQAEARSNNVSGSFKALLSTGVSSIQNRFKFDNERVESTGGSLHFSKASDLYFMAPYYSITQANGQIPLSRQVWTGSNANGTTNVSCNNWTSKAATSTGYSGYNTAASYWLANGTYSCNYSLRLYCISE